MITATALLLVGFGGACSPPPHGLPEDPRYFFGTLVSGGTAWEVGLEVQGAGMAVPRITADLPSLWRLRLPVDSVVAGPGDSLMMVLPEEVGRATVRVTGAGVSGTVAMPDGRMGVLDLAPAPVPVVHEREATLTSGSDGIAIAASVFLPDGPGPFPGVVVVHGGGDSSRELPGYRFWGLWLARHGVAALLYDKRGDGASAGNWRTVDFATRAGDVEAGIEHLRGTARVDPDRVGLLAVSQGSWIADIVAASDPRLEYVVHVSGPVVPVAAADGYANERSLRGRGAGDAVVRAHDQLWLEEVDAVLHPGDASRLRQVRESIARAAGQEWYPRFPYTLSDPEGWWWGWYGLVASFDPRPLLSGLRARSLWIYGDLDTQSDVARNAAEIQRLRDAGLPVALAILPGAGHGMMIPSDPFGGARGPMTVAPAFFALVFDWIHRRP